MDCDDYRRKFNIPLSTPLADSDLCERLSVSALQRLEDPVWLEQCIKACEKQSKQVKGTVLGPRNLPLVSKKHLIEMNEKTGESYRQRMVPIIYPDYMAGLTPMEIKRKHGVAVATLKSWEILGLLPKRRKVYCFE